MAENDLIQQGDGKFEEEAPVEAWDSIIALHESTVKSYENEYKRYLDSVWAKKRKGNLGTEKRILKNIADHKTTLRILKANRKRIFGA